MELETYEEIGLEDNGLPWPREIVLNGDLSQELKADPEAWKFAVEHIPDDYISMYGLRRAPGAEWEISWHEYTQKDIDHHNAFYFGMYCQAPFEVGDWHYRAVTSVVKIEHAED